MILQFRSEKKSFEIIINIDQRYIKHNFNLNLFDKLFFAEKSANEDYYICNVSQDIFYYIKNIIMQNNNNFSFKNIEDIEPQAASSARLDIVYPCKKELQEISYELSNNNLKEIPQSKIMNFLINGKRIDSDDLHPTYKVYYKINNKNILAISGYGLIGSRIVCREIKALGYLSWIEVE